MENNEFKQVNSEVDYLRDMNSKLMKENMLINRELSSYKSRSIMAINDIKNIDLTTDLTEFLRKFKLKDQVESLNNIIKSKLNTKIDTTTNKLFNEKFCHNCWYRYTNGECKECETCNMYSNWMPSDLNSGVPNVN